MKIISPLLLSSIVLFALVSHEEAMAGSCGPNGCRVTVVPSVQRPSVTASGSHSFTATGGSRVASINLSQEAREGIIADGKEPPLPKGFVSAADRAKQIAKQAPLYGWSDDNIVRSLPAQSRYTVATQISRNSRARVVQTPTRPIKPATPVKVAIAVKAR